jgi:hypothetical protein
MGARAAPVQMVIPLDSGNHERYGFAQSGPRFRLRTPFALCKTVGMASEAKDPAVVEYLRRSASRAGKGRLTSMTAEQRRESARRAAQARWGKKAVAPDPNNPPDPKGPNRDEQWAEAGIMSTPRRRPVTRVSSDHLGGESRAAA